MRKEIAEKTRRLPACVEQNVFTFRTFGNLAYLFPYI